MYGSERVNTFQLQIAEVRLKHQFFTSPMFFITTLKVLIQTLGGMKN